MAKNADMNVVLLFPKNEKGKVQAELVEAYGSPAALFSHHQDDLGITREKFNLHIFRHNTKVFENDKCLIVKTQTKRKKEEGVPEF